VFDFSAFCFCSSGYAQSRDGSSDVFLARSDAEISSSSADTQVQLWEESEVRQNYKGFLMFFTIVFLKSCVPSKATVYARGT